mmetsp:Transcript_65474/g.213122  ORF Transcript_65474/g.213122 Transcript_65474/m.213122 type:complete len:238 (+) Transcript_65474:238-951(+)
MQSRAATKSQAWPSSILVSASVTVLLVGHVLVQTRQCPMLDAISCGDQGTSKASSILVLVSVKTCLAGPVLVQTRQCPMLNAISCDDQGTSRAVVNPRPRLRQDVPGAPGPLPRPPPPAPRATGPAASPHVSKAPRASPAASAPRPVTLLRETSRNVCKPGMRCNLCGAYPRSNEPRPGVPGSAARASTPAGRAMSRRPAGLWVRSKPACRSGAFVPPSGLAARNSRWPSWWRLPPP